tara:strand:- start:615 stop:1055 length:441 start_codon:yes stop_codon:yes gene_type:complete
VAGFWIEKAMTAMSEREWESLCDGCGRCCLLKLEEIDAEKVHYTAAVCRYLDQKTCKCSQYKQRNKLVPTCVKFSSKDIESLKWMPFTCAYRKVAEGRDLDWWHHLVSGSKNTVHEAGISVRGKCVSELFVHPDDLDEKIIQWVHA